MTTISRLTLIAALSATLSAAAQDEDFAPPEGRPSQGQPPDGSPPRDFKQERPPFSRPRDMNDAPGGMMLERWMEKLRNDNPQEFERMQQLRDQNPEAFLGEVRRMFKQELGSRLQREHPLLFHAIQNLPAEERDWLLNRLLRPGPQGPDQKSGDQPQMPGPRGPPVDENEGAVRQLAQAYRAATDAGEEDKIKSQIRAELDKSFDRRMENRRADMAQFEGRIAEMKKNLDARTANRSAIVDKRLKELTEGENWAW